MSSAFTNAEELTRELTYGLNAQALTASKTVASDRRTTRLRTLFSTNSETRMQDSQQVKTCVSDINAKSRTLTEVKPGRLRIALTIRIYTQPQQGFGRLALGPYAAAIDVQGLPGDESRVVAGQKGDCADQIIGNFHPLDRLHLSDRCKFFIHGLEAWPRRPDQSSRRAGQAGCDRVYGDPVRCQIAGKRARESDDAALA